MLITTTRLTAGRLLSVFAPGQHLPLDFLPARSMVRVEGFGATMKMGQPFPGVWLPQDIDATGTFTLALGTFDAGYAVRYRNFREANVGMKMHVQ
jgi:hypothetical protein